MFNDANPALASATSLASLMAAIRGAYPKARITSGYRGPNHPLTQKNPNSYHAHGSPNDPMAVDVAPIPGVKFEDYVASIRKQGVPIAEALDEASHPKPWTTGPNWHLAQGSAPKGAAMPAPPKQPTTLASLMNQSAAVNMGGPLVAPPPEQQMMQPRTLADLNLDAPKIPEKKTLGLGKDQWAAMLAAAADAAYRYAGTPSNILGGYMVGQEKDEDRAFDREKWNGQLEVMRQKMMNPDPPAMVKNLQAWQTMTPDQRRQLATMQDVMNPVAVSGPQGTQRVPRVMSQTIGDTHYYNIGGEWYTEESE